MARLVPKKVRDMWVKALTDGSYTQTDGVLKNTGPENGFCCLGVLCDISEVGKWNDHEYTVVPDGVDTNADGYDDYYDTESSDTELFSAFREKLKIKEDFRGGGTIPEQYRQIVWDRMMKNHKNDKDFKLRTIVFEDFTSLIDLNDNGCTFEDIAWVIKNYM